MRRMNRTEIRRKGGSGGIKEENSSAEQTQEGKSRWLEAASQGRDGKE